MKNENAGIDYGLGQTNIDGTTGCRYGVIKINSLHEFIWDELDSEYGDPSCPRCGEPVANSSYGKDFYCDCCNEKFPDDDDYCTFFSEECYSDEAIGFTLEDKDYSAHSAFDSSCLFLTRSPYYTRTIFCSPCAPGAGDLDCPYDSGIKTFCFSHEMFEGNKAPYPVYRISDNSLVEPN